MQEILTTDAELVRTNLEAVLEKMRSAEEVSGRAPGTARLVCVTKSVGAPVIRELMAAGARDLGENRPEGMERLLAHLDDPELPAVRWHMIGTYQRRKIRDTLGHFCCVHSVHDLPLLEALDRRATGREVPVEVLLQVNVSGAPNKQGVAAEGVQDLLSAAEGLGNLRVTGLMTMAEAGASEAELRATFSGLREIRDRHQTPDRPLSELSMGMSGDYEIAIQEGATLVRVGSALFQGLSRTYREVGRA